MRKTFIYLLSICLFFIAGISNFNAQKLETEKTHQLSKDAKKGYLGSFTYNETSKEYTLVFVREKKKKAVYVTYKFDYDFNQISENEETLTDLEASAKFDFMEFTEEPWLAPSVVRVDGTDWNANQVKLKKGYIYRRWIPASTTTVGNYSIYRPGYWKFEFKVEEKVKPRIHVDINLDPNTPPMIVKMVNKSASKIQMITYLTDEPSFNVNTGAMIMDVYGKNKGQMGRSARRDKAYIESTGNILLIGQQQWYIEKDYNRRYVALQFSAKDFAQTAETIIEFDYIYGVVAHKSLPDKSIALIFAPAGYAKNPDPNPNTREFYYIRINKNTEVVERIKFESPSSRWEINDFVVAESGDVYVYGAASKAKNDKHFDKLASVWKFDNFQLLKISDSKVAYITSTGMDEFESKLQFPSNMKKVDSYEGKKFAVGPLTVTSAGDVFVSGQEANEGKFGNINLFHFDKMGVLKAQYGYRLVETSKEATGGPTSHIEFENPDGKTLTWIVYEMNGSTESKLLLYPRVATIDLEKATVSDFHPFGYNKNQSFYVDNNRPIVLIDNYSKAVFFGADKKDKMLWFSRVALGQ